MPSPDARRVPPDRYVTVHEATAEPQLTIVMPVFEQAAFVSEAVASVLDQRDVVAEVIISDDASSDATFDVALGAIRDRLASPGMIHRLVIRRSSLRLRRRHLHALVDHASCDVVMAAHGDDVARPDRAARLLAALEHTGAAMAASRCHIIDDRGQVTRTAGADGPDRMLELDEVVAGPSWLIGAVMAWRRSALAPFGPLTGSVAPVGQDRVMGARAWWAGGVVAVQEPLLLRRVHKASWHRREVDSRRSDASAFGLAVMRSCRIDAMLDDVTRAESLGLATAEQAALAREVLDGLRRDESEALRAAYATLEADGLAPLWVTEEELRLAARGALVARLRRQAAASAPVRAAARAGRRIRGR